MALWRVRLLSKRLAALADKHPPQTDTTDKENRKQPLKARAATKIGAHAQAFHFNNKRKKIEHILCSTFNENGGDKGRGGRCRSLGGECGVQSELRLYLSPPRTIVYDSKFLIPT